MTQAILKPVTFDEFIDWYPENSINRYELHNGTIVEKHKATGEHSEVAGFLCLKLGMEIERLRLPYFVPKECVVKADNELSGYEPDAIVLDRQGTDSEPRWKKQSIITMGSSVRLIVEVVSTNWRDDYGYKLVDYEALGISEYWIADYFGLGGRRYIGNPKQPTFFVHHLVDGEYQLSHFRGTDRIVSPTFPELNLTVQQIFSAGRDAV
ncbi:MAG: Uma2 family endonuclease [Microcoleus sp. PH2017_10_PVI_O_A]|uniref:Uma2 family endonuclease n=1 Tax=unclassified Microcoleus TaxID=2642155 RepID=UPI001D9E1AA4|nr:MULTISPECIES: Uma2 family endonuclease [unclassified Microcoleus]TAE82929.1 MAG: Uma2 family endonuclease [Oscillatoriales cyanobacterium]MCC3409552.1 Uma2 family endonuclease [Microcoleus sp. PH2017_10_PVI_O_A]MCC3460562.1 Uma2 family endonuclease [Microcoleus sp. PH2017_11_PCY_U_A]MCC3479055.1 Uma2 family endonuclease [Microcoleus sp. PH2017_12_PCY_D_A]MCC3532044.1 Uma2 family endonuclease [Microcoleus sp. PH2017_21_RUC_O_A]